MKTLKPIFLGLMLLGGCVSWASAQTDRTNVNPALLYYQSFLEVPKPMADADWEYLGSRESGDQKLPDRFGGFAAAYDNQYKLLRRAAASSVQCDWGIDILKEGPGTILSHLPKSKAAAVALPLRVTWDLQHGKQNDARDDMVAVLVLGRNVGRDGTLIGMLVQIAIEAIDYATIADHFGQFSTETLQQIVAGFDAAPPRVSAASCVATEKATSYDWSLRRIAELQKQNPADDAKTLAAIRQLLISPEAEEEQKVTWEQILKASGGTSGGIVRLIREVEPYYPRLTKVLSLPLPEYEVQMKQLRTERDNTTNPILKMALQPMDRVRAKEFRVQIYQAMVRAAVEYRLHGESGIKNVTDPCGNGPFAFRRFVFEGVDRGFELKSAYPSDGKPEVMIFTEKTGPKFMVNGVHAGEARPSSKTAK